MSDAINFVNHETQKELSLKLDKDFIVVYGRNGAGKTTLSRSAPDKELVFNTDFIYKNIYVESSTGAKDDASTKESFSSLWIGDDVVSARKKYNDLVSDNKTIQTRKDALIRTIKDVFAQKKIEVFDFNRFDDAIQADSFSKPEGKSDDDIINAYKTSRPQNTSIHSDEELEAKIVKFNEQNMIKMLCSELKSHSLIQELLLNDAKTKEEQLKFLALLTDYNQVVQDLKTIDSVYFHPNDPVEEKWIENALKIHETVDECLFCGNKDISKAKEKWRQVVGFKAKEVKRNLSAYVEDFEKKADEISLREKGYSVVSKITCDSLRVLSDYARNIKSLVETDKEIPASLLNIPEVSKDSLIVDSNQLLVDIQNYLFAPYHSEYECLVLLEKDYAKQINAKENDIKNALNSAAKDIAVKINRYLTKMDLDKELEIKVDNRGNGGKYSYGFKNKKTKINELSDGQKHKLAFAIFLAKLFDTDLNSKVVVLDDPVVTMDQRAYHSVKDIVIQIRNKGPKCLIITTYNLAYLQVQLSYFFNKEEAKTIEMVHLHQDRLQVVDPNILNYDDLTLYRKCLSQVSSQKEFCLLAGLNNRICRHFLDLCLRMKGIPSSGNPADEIKALPIEESEKKVLNDLQGEVVKLVRKKSASNKDLYQTFLDTDKFITALGFPRLFSSDDLIRLKVFENGEARDDFGYNGENLLFEIVSRACKLLNGSAGEKYSDIVRYINHPRSQITSTIIGVDFTDVEISDFESSESE